LLETRRTMMRQASHGPGSTRQYAHGGAASG
jgi:hypothetical protein